MLFATGLRITKTISVSCIFSLLMLTAPQPAMPRRAAPPMKKQAATPPLINARAYQQQVISVALWRTDHEFVSTIHIKNSLTTGPMTVSPVLYSDRGEEYDLPSTTIPAAGITSVVVNQALDAMSAKQRSRFGTFGSAAIKYNPNGAGGVNASMVMLDVSASLSYSFPFFSYMPMSDSMTMSTSTTMSEPTQQVAEGVWWKHDPGVEGHVALANSAGNPISATVQVVGSKGSKTHLKSLTLAPYALSVLDLAEFESDLPESERDRGGVTIKYMASSAQIAMAGWLENAAEGYSAKIPIIEKMSQGAAARAATSNTLASVGIMYGQQMMAMGFPDGTSFVPYAEVRNLTSKQRRISMTVLPGNGGVATEKSLGDLVLDAFETKQVNPRMIEKALPNASGAITLTFSYNGVPGDLMFATGSVDQTGNYVFEVPIGGVGPSKGREVAYWSVKDGDDTMISVWNPTSSSENLNVTVCFAGEDGQTKTYLIAVPLAPRAAANISLMDLIMSGPPDAQGNVIPRTVTEGSLIISAASGRHDKATFVVQVGTFNAAHGTCWPNCTQCDGVCYIVLTVPQGMAEGSFKQASVTAHWFDGSTTDDSSASSYTSDSTANGPLDPNYLDSGTLYSISLGTTRVQAQDQEEYTGCLECEESANCLEQNFSASASVTVLSVTISIQSDSSYLIPLSDTARGAYQGETGTYYTGPILDGVDCSIGFQATGTINPSSYGGTVILTRTRQGTEWIGTDGKTQNGSTDPFGTPDNSSPAFEVTTPTNGVVYDLDAPFELPANGQIYRKRKNFYESAYLPDGTEVDNGTVGFYVRLSCQGPPNNLGSATWATDVSGDNVLGMGQTNTTWNLQ